MTGLMIVAAALTLIIVCLLVETYQLSWGYYHETRQRIAAEDEAARLRAELADLRERMMPWQTWESR